MKPLQGEGLKYMDCKWSSVKSNGEGPCIDMELVVDPGPKKGARTVVYTMRDEEGFYKALSEKYGIEREWIEWKAEYSVPDPCTSCPVPVGAPGCPVDPCAGNFQMNKNYPRRNSDGSKIDVVNPKKVIDEALPSIDDLATVGWGSYLEMRLGTLDADFGDVALSFAMPIFMLEDARVSIEAIKEIGEEQESTKTRELVLNILSIVFAAIPFAGEAAVALGGAASIARAAAIIGEAANAAISIVEIVNDPLSAPFAIVGMLIGAAGLRTKGPRAAFKEAADARRALDAAQLGKFSAEFRRKDTLVQNIVKRCGV